ncbi:MAG: DUF4124 domain-containing protein [Gammaproteobacteria bacterium]|nr:DUF4124 domain-containing protein [Gammaproteobacteria bacterium]
MNKTAAICLLVAGLAQTASADVWKWVDDKGKTHFVDTMTAIYTWTDEEGARHYSDTPDHENAISVDLVWHSSGTLADVEGSGEADLTDDGAYPGETEADRIERQRAEAYFCKRATEIYESYLAAPQLYRTNDNGEREYLSKRDAAKTLAETRAKKDDLCS